MINKLIDPILYPTKKILKKSKFYANWLIKNKRIMTFSEINDFVNDAPILKLKKDLTKKPNIGIVKSQSVNIKDGYENPKASWLRYERFCKNNDIPYSFYDIEKSDWLERAKSYDIIVCHTEDSPSYQDMIESKIYILDKVLNKTCFPSFHEVWQYEDKNRSHYLYKNYNLPTIPTLVTHDEREALKITEEGEYPFITKTSIGSGSSGVHKINTKKHSKNIIHKIFSKKGLSTQYLYQNHKNYFYHQKFIDDATFDLRIILVGDMAFGYYRYPNKGDFRASGAGNFEKKAIPIDALKLAIEVRNKLQSRQMGVDLLYSKKHAQYFIIETSLFNQIDSPIQLEVDGRPGYYDISDVNNILFKEGKFWIQELVLRDIVTQWSEPFDSLKY